jgi:hypothetical protein
MLPREKCPRKGLNNAESGAADPIIYYNETLERPAH